MTITLPDELRAEVEAKAKAAGFATPDEYVLALCLRARRAPSATAEPSPDEAARARLLALAEEGLRSPPIADPDRFLAGLATEKVDVGNGNP